MKLLVAVTVFAVALFIAACDSPAAVNARAAATFQSVEKTKDVCRAMTTTVDKNVCLDRVSRVILCDRITLSSLRNQCIREVVGLHEPPATLHNNY